MARPPKQQARQRESPIQFRPGSELGHLVRNFATGHGLTLPEACRLLLCLAVAEMDCRFAGLILPLSGVMGGENAYVRACEHVHTALQAARRKTGEPIQMDPERADFIEQTVKAALADRGAADMFRPLEFLAQERATASSATESQPQTRSAAKKKRSAKVGLGAEDKPHPAAQQELEDEEAAPWRATEEGEGGERVPVRP